MCWIYLLSSGNLKPYLHTVTTGGWQPVLINNRHGSFITILWESKSCAETQQPQPASLRTLACSTSGSALKKTFGSGCRRKVRGSRKEVQTKVGFLCLTYKALCQSVMKKSCVNTSSQISLNSSCSTLGYNKTNKGWKLWDQPWLSWWDPPAMPLALPVFSSWICTSPWASPSFHTCLLSGLGSCPSCGQQVLW